MTFVWCCVINNVRAKEREREGGRNEKRGRQTDRQTVVSKQLTGTKKKENICMQRKIHHSTQFGEKAPTLITDGRIERRSYIDNGRKD